MIKRFQSQFINRIALFGLGTSILFIAANLQFIQLQKTSANTLINRTYSKQEKSEKLNLSILKQMPTFGFNNLIADWTMLKFLQYFGDGKARKQTGYSLSPKYLEIIADRDPLFVKAYTVISPVSSMFAGHPERTVSIMNKGLSKIPPNTPDAYYIWIYKAIDETLFLGDLQKAQNSYEKASEWAEIAGNEQVAKSANNTAKFLASKPDASQAQVGAWFIVWNSTVDERVRELAKTKIESIGGELKIYPDGRVQAIPPNLNKSSS